MISKALTTGLLSQSLQDYVLAPADMKEERKNKASLSI